MINGLDLFSGIGGIALALKPWVQPLAYCEIERYAQAVLLSRMESGEVPVAPIWDDITTLAGSQLRGRIEIISGGFPCQDISVAGAGRGLEGERSGLFFQIVRLVEEIRPTFIFLENVPAITSRGGCTVVRTLTELGYDCRWKILSAGEIGAPHLRKRWWLLAYASGELLEAARIQRGTDEAGGKQGLAMPCNNIWCDDWQEVAARCERVVDGLPNWVDRTKGLGNAVVPLQAREAFKELMGLRGCNEI